MMSIEQLKAAIAQTAARPPHASVGPHELAIVRAAVADEIAKRCSWAAIEHIREEHHLSEVYGLDTLDRVALAVELELRLGLGELDFVGWRTVADVVAAVSRALAPPHP